MVLCCLVVCAAYIDADTMTIPDCFTVGGTVAGLILSAAIPMGFHRLGWEVTASPVNSFRESFVGMLVGSSVLLWIAIFTETVLKRDTMGGGDVKLMGAIGAFVGWKGAVFSIFAGAVLGVAWIGFCVLFKAVTRRELKFGAKVETPDGQDGDIAMGSHISFGPMLGWASVVYALAIAPRLDEITALWFSTFSG
jgi:leader peptidase (prepilin peptidase)/N-methyltransferase